LNVDIGVIDVEGRKKGMKVQDFTLLDQNKEEFTLSKFVGRKVLLSFHPLAWTAICSEQMLSIEEHWSDFMALDTIAVGVSVDTVPSKKAWASNLGIERTRLLSDFWPHGEVSNMLGVFREKEGFSERANLIVDEEGKLIFSRIYPIKELPDIREILEVLQGLL
jgi:peroxiredoxin